MDTRGSHSSRPLARLGILAAIAGVTMLITASPAWAPFEGDGGGAIRCQYMEGYGGGLWHNRALPDQPRMIYKTTWQSWDPAHPYQAIREDAWWSMTYTYHVGQGGYHVFANNVDVPRISRMDCCYDGPNRHWAVAGWSAGGC